MLASSCRAAFSAPFAANLRNRRRESGSSLVNRGCCALALSFTSESTAQHLVFVPSVRSPGLSCGNGAHSQLVGWRQPCCLKRLPSVQGGNYERRKGLCGRGGRNSRSSNYCGLGSWQAEAGEGEQDTFGDSREGSQEPLEVDDEKIVTNVFGGFESGTSEIWAASEGAGMDNSVEAKGTQEGTLLGAVALITGTSVGVGILALPARTGPAGFIPSAAVLGVSWGFLLVEALLIAEVNVGVMHQLRKSGQRDVEIVSLRTMAVETLGDWGGNLVAWSYLLLSYTLMVAYIVKAEDVMSSLLHVPTEAAALSFSLGLGSLLLFGGTPLIDLVNQMLTFGLLCSFMILVVGGASVGEWTRLGRMDWLAAPAAIPVVFLALVFHDLIPVLCSYLGGDIPRIRLCLFAGSAVPLLMLLIWDGVAFSFAPVSGVADPLDVLVSSGAAGPVFLIQVFALLAVATSFIGTYLGMFEFFVEQIRKFNCNVSKSANRASFRQPEFASTSSSKAEPAVLTQPASLISWIESAAEFYGRPWTRLLSFVLVMSPPLAISLSLPTSAFLSAANLAGAYGMTALYGIFPPLMAWNFNNKREEGRPRKMLEGKVALAGLSACALGVILLQLAADISLLPGGVQTEIVTASSQENPVVLCTYKSAEE